MKGELMKKAAIGQARHSEVRRHTPRNRRPSCIAIRPDLDPWYYPTLESFEAAIADRALHREYGCRTKDECRAAASDSVI